MRNCGKDSWPSRLCSKSYNGLPHNRQERSRTFPTKHFFGSWQKNFKSSIPNFSFLIPN